MAAAQRPSFTNFKLVTDLWVRLALLLASRNFKLCGLHVASTCEISGNIFTFQFDPS